MISIIVAHANNQVIGSKNDLPWYLPNDLKRFKELTTGHTVIAGRNTFESIINRLGKPLPDRKNIVVSRTKAPGEGFSVVPSLAEAIRRTNEADETFIIGGAQIYRSALGLTDKIYLTKIDADIDGDVFFPPLSDEDGWAITSIEKHSPDERHAYPYRFITLERQHG